MDGLVIVLARLKTQPGPLHTASLATKLHAPVQIPNSSSCKSGKLGNGCLTCHRTASPNTPQGASASLVTSLQSCTREDTRTRRFAGGKLGDGRVECCGVNLSEGGTTVASLRIAKRRMTAFLWQKRVQVLPLGFAPSAHSIVTQANCIHFLLSIYPGPENSGTGYSQARCA